MPFLRSHEPFVGVNGFQLGFMWPFLALCLNGSVLAFGCTCTTPICFFIFTTTTTAAAATTTTCTRTTISPVCGLFTHSKKLACSTTADLRNKCGALHGGKKVTGSSFLFLFAFGLNLYPTALWIG